MPRAIRFHLDENCAKAFVEGLKRRGIDVTTTPEAGFMGVIREQQAPYCVAVRRDFFTQAEDFLRLHAAAIRP
jgi:hypothetical protein